MQIELCKFSYMIGILLLIDVETPKIFYIESVVTWLRWLKRWTTLDISFQQIVWFVYLTLIQQITIYLVDSIIQPWKNLGCDQYYYWWS